MYLFEELREYETLWDSIDAKASGKTDIESFFTRITRTPIDALQFINDYLKPAVAKIGSDATRQEISREFAKILLEATDVLQKDVILGGKYGYRKFLARLADIGVAKNNVEQAILGNEAAVSKILNSERIVLTLDQYFKEITGSKEAAISFIKALKHQVKDLGYSISRAYNRAIASKVKDATAWTLSDDLEHNYVAFINAISQYGLNAKDVRSICQKGIAKANAIDTFAEITASQKAVEEFMHNLRQQYTELSGSSNTRMVYRLAYNKWFLANTNATIASQNKIKPEEVDWNSFTEMCWKKFGITVRDLTALYRSELNAEPKVRAQDIY